MYRIVLNTVALKVFVFNQLLFLVKGRDKTKFWSWVWWNHLHVNRAKSQNFVVGLQILDLCVELVYFQFKANIVMKSFEVKFFNKLACKVSKVTQRLPGTLFYVVNCLHSGFSWQSGNSFFGENWIKFQLNLSSSFLIVKTLNWSATFQRISCKIFNK